MEEMRGKVKKVLIFGLSSLYAGVEALILNYVNHLDENEYAVDLVVAESQSILMINFCVMWILELYPIVLEIM